MSTHVATSDHKVPEDTDDFYAVLGVLKTATFDEIKQAYRVLAMKYHPDRNVGDERVLKIFQAVQTAYDTLMDPDKRAYYDEIGKIKPSEDALRDDALTVLHQNLIACIDALVQSPDPSAEPWKINPVREVKGKLTAELTNAHANIKLLKRAIKRYEDVLKRFKSKKNPDFEKSQFGVMMITKIGNVKNSIEQILNMIAVHKYALQMIDDYDYDMFNPNPPNIIINTGSPGSTSAHNAATTAMQEAQRAQQQELQRMATQLGMSFFNFPPR